MYFRKQRDRKRKITWKEQEADFKTFFETKDPELRERLILNNRGLVRDQAKKFQNSPELPLDIIQEGYHGLIKAIDRFDPGEGTRFSSFAKLRILGEIKNYVERQLKYSNKFMPLEGENPHNDSGYTNLIEIYPTESLTATHMDGYNKTENKILAEYLLNSQELTEKQRKLIDFLFFQEEELTQKQIARSFGVSNRAVSGLKQRAFKKLRKRLEDLHILNTTQAFS